MLDASVSRDDPGSQAPQTVTPSCHLSSPRWEHRLVVGSKTQNHGAPRRLPRTLVLVALALLVAGCSAGARSATPRHTPARAKVEAGSAPTTSTTTPCTNARVVAMWTLTQRAEQLVVVPVEETDVQSILPSVQQGVGGIILFGSTAPTNLGGQLSTLEADAPDQIRAFVMTDEEGGGVQRMANLVGSLPWPRTMATTMDPTQVRQLAQQTAAKMLTSGITMDLAPVLDLASGPGPDTLHTDGPRSFSPVPATAAEYGLAFAQGLQAGGVIPVVKHFPGEGSATANTDDAPASTPPFATLQGTDLLPFETAITGRVPAVMVGNASVPGLTTSPASLSSAVIEGLLRQRLGFDGLVITDSLSAGAITARGLDIPSASVDAIEAGADMVLFNSTNPNTTAQQIVSRIVSAVSTGEMPLTQLDDAVLQVLTAKHISLCSGP